MDTITIENINLVDDPTPTGGKSFDGETLDDFIKETFNETDKATVSLGEINDQLATCGIEKISEDQIVFLRPLRKGEEIVGRNFTQEEWAIFAKIDEDCLREDIMWVASDIFDCDLTDEQMDAVVEIYTDTESMEIAKKTTIENAIERVIYDGEED